MNMLVSTAIPATQRHHPPRKCASSSSANGKLGMLKAVSARRGMPFEWSFLLDALQTERDPGITIDTTQIRFRTRSRDGVLIDAPGHAEFLHNMITGVSQADGAVQIIDALEGVRDRTRRHGYLLHLLGVKQVAVVVNKMDRVDFSTERFNAIRKEIFAHLIGLGVTPTAIIPISARDGDGVATRTANIGWYDGPTVVEALDALEPARPLEQPALRLPVQSARVATPRAITPGRARVPCSASPGSQPITSRRPRANSRSNTSVAANI